MSLRVSAMFAVLLGAVLVLPVTVRGQGPAAQFPASGNVDGSHWSRLVNVAAAGKVIFGSMASDKSPDSAVAASRNTLADFWFYDMEHTPFDMETFRVWLQFLLDPTAIRAQSRPSFVPVLVRIPANGREMNQWMAKQILDTGGMGIIAPFIENADQARNLVQATRYPQRPDSPHYEPRGHRGSGAGNAVRYLGVPFQQYRAKADVWPLNPEGEIFNLLLIENAEGVRNIREIVQVPGVSAVVPAPGDLSSYYLGDQAAVERDIQTVLAACQEFNVICGITSGPNDVEQRIKEGFRLLIGSDEMIRIGHKVAGR